MLMSFKLVIKSQSMLQASFIHPSDKPQDNEGCLLSTLLSLGAWG